MFLLWLRFRDLERTGVSDLSVIDLRNSVISHGFNRTVRHLGRQGRSKILSSIKGFEKLDCGVLLLHWFPQRANSTNKRVTPRAKNGFGMIVGCSLSYSTPTHPKH